MSERGSSFHSNSPSIAVEVRDLRVSYGRGFQKNHVINGLYLKAHEGLIYGLLGPSGCGKTSLLKCIVGLQTPNGGHITIFGTKPGSSHRTVTNGGVGYMPQDLALYQELTIQETLNFFGQLYGLSYTVLKDRSQFLQDFLNLPDKARLVNNLSLGEKRRVSLAVALVHSPPLLILDEPTVGVDPLLSRSIWQHLLKITKQDHTTVIITTHYIEEARQANVIGLMREGRLLAESSPSALMRQYKVSTVEDVFLRLCQKQDDYTARHTAATNQRQGALEMSDLVKVVRVTHLNTHHRENNVKKQSLYSTVGSSLNRTQAMIVKNFRCIKRHRILMFFHIILPALQQALFCLSIGRDPFDVPVAVVNKETVGLSQAYLNKVSSNIVIQKNFSDAGTAFRSVVSGETRGVITIGENFTTDLTKRLAMGLKTDEATLNGSLIRVYLDMTNQPVGYTLQKTVISAFLEFSQEMLKALGKNPVLATPPVSIEHHIYGHDGEFTEYISPGVMLCLIFLLSVGMTTLVLIEEKNQGLLDRCFVSGVKPTEFLMSHCLLNACIVIAQVPLVLIVNFAAFGYTSQGSLVVVVVLTILQGCCGMAYGLLISSLCTHSTSAVILANGSFYPFALLSGVLWPLDSMPYFLRYISYCLPQTIPSEALRGIISKGWTITQPTVWIALIVSVGWLVFFFVAALLLFRVMK